MLVEIFLIIGFVAKPSFAATTTAIRSTSDLIGTTATEYTMSEFKSEITTQDLETAEPTTETTTTHSTTSKYTTGKTIVESSESAALFAPSSPNSEIITYSVATAIIAPTTFWSTSEVVSSSVASSLLGSSSVTSETSPATTLEMHFSSATTSSEGTAVTLETSTSITTDTSSFAQTITTPAPSTTSTSATTGTYHTTSSTMPTTTSRDPCSSNPCRNGGICTRNGDTTYTCTCIPGFRGSLCEYEINECESYPCDPFGKCTDLVNDYSCSCIPGYKPVENSTKICNAIDYCEGNSSCFNGGTCVNQPQLARFYCICPPSSNPNEVIVGLQCENRTTTYPTPEAISPNSSIIAGGARVKITGKAMDLFAPLGAYLISKNNPNLTTLHALVDPKAIFSDSITIVSPRASDSYVNTTLLIILEYSGPVNLTNATEFFTYQGNPVISDIRPKDPLIVGGVQLTILGQNMDAVEHPVMEVTTVVQNKTTDATYSSKLSEDCTPKNSTEMTCLLPSGVVPPAFVNGVNVRSVRATHFVVFPHLQGLNHSRRTKRAPLANFSIPDGSTCELYLGFILDALPTYENTSKSLPHIVFTFTTTFPNISTEQDAKEFNPETADYILIKGDDMASGCSIADYTVGVGNDTCVVFNLTENELLCHPPKQMPPAGKYQELCLDHEGTLAVIVNISTKSYFAYCLRYTSSENTDSNKPLIIGLTVAGAVIVLVIICLVIAILIMKKRKTTEREARQKEVVEYETLATERKHSGVYQFLTKVPTDESRSEIEVYELPNNDDLDTEPPENPASSMSEVDYSTTTNNETGETTFGATFHSETTDYVNSFGMMAKDSQEQNGKDKLQKFEYVSNDPSLKFDLKSIKLQEEAFKLPRLRIEGGDKKRQVNYHDRREENGYF